MDKILLSNKLPKTGNADTSADVARHDAARLEQKSREFEALLLQQMIAAMEPKEGLFGQGFGGAYFQALFREELAKELAKEVKLGLAEQLMRAHLRQGSREDVAAEKPGKED